MRFFFTRSVLLILTLLLGNQLYAQSPVERRANRLFENFAYEPAIELYEAVIRKNPENKAVIRNLAESYRKTNNTQKAEVWYARIMDVGIARNEDYLTYAQLLETNGKRDEARTWFEKYDQLMGSDKRGARHIASITNYADLFSESGQWEIKPISDNSDESDFSPTYYKDGIIKVSARGSSAYIKSVFPWNNRRWLDLYYAPFVGDSMPGEFTKLPNTINTRYHEGPASYSKSLNTLAFTRNNYLNGKVTRSSDHINKLKIFFTSPKGDEWTDPVNFEHNSNEYSTGHPAFTADGNTMYFVSDMPGGYGGTDIWVSTCEGGKWTKPENLGPKVNTEGNELFPFVLNDNLLVFASNGWGGLGGLDIFKVPLENGKPGQIENLGSPVNSQYDDFGLIFNPNGRKGFFSSNRSGGKGDDDIYSFTYTPRPSAILVIDQDDIKPVQNANVSWQTNAGGTMFSGTSNVMGQIDAELKPCEWYTFTVKADGYPDKVLPIQTSCPRKPGEEIRILIRRPKVYGSVFDKYNHVEIPGATVTLIDLTDNNKESGTAVTDEKGYFKLLLKPCHQYKIVATKEGFPEVSRTFKAPCSDKEDDIVQRLGTGIMPSKGAPVNISVTDEQSGSPVPNARLGIQSKAGDMIEVMTDDNGVYETVLKDNTYKISTSKPGYFSTSKSKAELTVSKGTRKLTGKLTLLKLREGGVIALEGIYYDLNKHEIRPDAAMVLDYVVQVMEENPTMRIELGSHTDSQASDEYNLTLSQKRANAAAEYIVSKGIDADRIVAVGYGETQLKNHCGNGVKCPDKLHQENRRTEIRILDYE